MHRPEGFGRPVSEIFRESKRLQDEVVPSEDTDSIGYPSSSFEDPVRIAFVTTIGMTQWLFLRGQLHYYRARGFEPYAICAGDDYSDMLEADGIPVLRVPFTRKRGSFWQDCVAAFVVYRTLRRIRPVVVHASTPKASLVALAAASVLRVPVRIFLMRGTMTPRFRGFKRVLAQLAERVTASMATNVICVSQSLLSFARTSGILTADAGVVLHHGMSNGVDCSQFTNRRSRPGGIRLGYVGRLAADKGIEELYQAWQRISQLLPSATLTLAGARDDADAVSRSCVEAFEADSRVRILGSVEQVASVYEELDVVLLLSRGSEGFPNVPMEAAAAGVPAIVTGVIGNVDAVIHGVTGVIVKEGGVEAVVNAVCLYARSPALISEHGHAAKLRAMQQFGQEQVWEAHYRFLHECASQAKSTSGSIARREAQPAT